MLSFCFLRPSRSIRNRSVSPLLPQVLVCFLQSKTRQGTGKKKGKILLTLPPAPLALNKVPVPLEKELWGFSPSAPSFKAQGVLHMLSLLVVWLQTHSFITLVRGTSASALQAALLHSALYFHILQEVR